jgi:hypothetical protein
MDPVTPLGAILGLAGKAWDLGRYIHNIYQGTKTVDTSVRNLGREVQDLASTCDLVHEEMASVLTAPTSEKHGSPYDPDGTLEKCICGQVRHCDSTIEELREIAERLWPRKKKFLDRTARQLRLQDAKEQIEDIRARIRSHTDALHTVLHVLSIKVAHVSPGQAMGQLPETLDDLRESILRIEAKLEQHPVHESSIDRDTPALVEYARGTLQSGMTLCDGTVTDSTVGVDSVVGGEQAAVTNKTVAEWISSAERAGHARQDVLPEHVADVNTNADTLQHSEPSTIPQGEYDYDSDDEHAEFAKAAFEAGSCAFNKQDWQSANGYLTISKKAFMGLPVSHRDTSTLFELQHKVAMCSYHLGSFVVAETELQGLLQLEPESDEHRIEQCNIYHTLAEIYVRQNKLDTAKVVCKKTLQARSRLLGKLHASRFESIALLSRICELLGEEVHANVYLSMIPDDQRGRLIAAASILQPSDVDEVVSSTPMETPILSLGTVEVLGDFSGSSTDCTPSGASILRRSPDGSDSTTRAARTLSIAGPTPHGHLSEETEFSGSSHEECVLGDTLRDHPRKHALSPQHRTLSARDPAVGPKADGKGLQVSTPKQTEEVRAVKSLDQEAWSEIDAGRALVDAITSHDADAVRALLQCRSVAVRRRMLAHQNSRGRTPLYYAVDRAANKKRLSLDIVRIMLDHGADPAQGMTRAYRYTTARMRAIDSDRKDLIDLVCYHAYSKALRKMGWKT